MRDQKLGLGFSESTHKFDTYSLVIYNVKTFAKPQEAKYNLDPKFFYFVFQKVIFFDKERAIERAPNL